MGRLKPKASQKNKSMQNDWLEPLEPRLRIEGLSREDETSFLMAMCIKCSDVSNAAKPFSTYDQWAKLIMKEFYSQGELELKKHMQITNYMDKRAPKFSQCQ